MDENSLKKIAAEHPKSEVLYDYFSAHPIETLSREQRELVAAHVAMCDECDFLGRLVEDTESAFEEEQIKVARPKSFEVKQSTESVIVDLSLSKRARKLYEDWEQLPGCLRSSRHISFQSPAQMSAGTFMGGQERLYEESLPDIPEELGLREYFSTLRVSLRVGRGTRVTVAFQPASLSKPPILLPEGIEIQIDLLDLEGKTLLREPLHLTLGEMEEASDVADISDPERFTGVLKILVFGLPV
jgi:hypothetical protein